MIFETTMINETTTIVLYYWILCRLHKMNIIFICKTCYFYHFHYYCFYYENIVVVSIVIIVMYMHVCMCIIVVSFSHWNSWILFCHLSPILSLITLIFTIIHYYWIMPLLLSYLLSRYHTFITNIIIIVYTKWYNTI